MGLSSFLSRFSFTGLFKAKTVRKELDDRSRTDLESQGGAPSLEKLRSLPRCQSAPAMISMITIKDFKAKTTEVQKPSLLSKSIIKPSMILLGAYLALGAGFYFFNRDHYSGDKTNPFVDALYFCIVTLSTIGYGDIAPSTRATKIFTVFFVLIGFGLLNFFLSGVVNYVLDLQDSMILRRIKMGSSRNRCKFWVRDCIVDLKKGQVRTWLKVGLALCAIVLCIGVGSLVLFFVESRDYVDSIYLSVMSVTTVGYGDMAFKTWKGRIFAAVWLFFSTLVVARAFLYLVDARIDHRYRKAVKHEVSVPPLPSEMYNVL